MPIRVSCTFHTDTHKQFISCKIQINLECHKQFDFAYIDRDTSTTHTRGEGFSLLSFFIVLEGLIKNCQDLQTCFSSLITSTGNQVIHTHRMEPLYKLERQFCRKNISYMLIPSFLKKTHQNQWFDKNLTSKQYLIQ